MRRDTAVRLCADEAFRDPGTVGQPGEYIILFQFIDFASFH
jgi:hypothetical protein